MNISNETFFFDPKTGEFMPLPEKDGELEIVFFKSNVNTLIDERPAIISWQVLHAAKVRINNKSVALIGSMTFHTSESQTIKLIAKNKKKQSIERSLYIAVNKMPPIIGYFKVSKSSVTKDSIVTLSWNVTGAIKIHIDNGIGDVTGKTELKVTAYKDAEYKLTAKSYFGVETYEYASLVVFPSQLISSLNIPIPEFNIKPVSVNQLTYDLQTAINTNIEIRQPVFTGLHEISIPDILTTQILLKKSSINSILFANNIFKYLIKKQKDINYIIKRLWKTKIESVNNLKD